LIEPLGARRRVLGGRRRQALRHRFAEHESCNHQDRASQPDQRQRQGQHWAHVRRPLGYARGSGRSRLDYSGARCQAKPAIGMEARMKIVLFSSIGLMQALLPLAFAAGASGKTSVSLGTATPGGGFPVYGEAVAATVNGVEPTLEVVPQNTKGSA